MNETQRKIKEYQLMLPGLRERVAAVAMLLVVSFTMMVSASFAWYTLSQAPEVSMMATTISGNGNLEIALVGRYDEEGVVQQPNESAVGDSSAAEGQTLTGANITWGNLVNLSDATYGLSEISLRPALLSGYNLTKAPLYGATYSHDGRVQDVSQTYVYASWTEKPDGDGWYFDASDNSRYGVRAITSVQYANFTGNAAVTAMWTNINNAYATAIDEYTGIITGETKVAEGISCMDALAALMQLYVQEKADTMLGTGSAADYSGQVTYAYRLVCEFFDVIEAEGEALLYQANLQAYLADNSRGTETFKTIEELVGHDDATLENQYNVKLQSLGTYRTSRRDILKAMDGLDDLAVACDPASVANPPVVRWSQISTPIQYLVDIASARIDDMPIGTLSRDDIVSLGSILTSNSKNNMSSVVIYKGALRDTEQRLGAFLDDKDIWLSIRLTVQYSFININNKEVFATVVTDASDKDQPFDSNFDRAYTSGLENTGTGGDAIAKDTYGMAIDLWVRTNMQDTMLILEGSLETVEETVTCIDKNGDSADVYTMTYDGGDTTVYMLEEEDADGNPITNVYNSETNVLLGSKGQLEADGYTIASDPDTKKVVVGFHGENRIWEEWESLMEAGLIHADSTTQGSGSCYVFYADNPSDQSRILELLEAFTIAFLEQDGTNIATARLDTENAYAINGKVTVPLKLTSGFSYQDEEGLDRLGITPLTINEATWITAIIYLDGMRLTNEQVLAAGEIEGRLNIQFALNTSLDAIDNGELQAKYRTITASASYGDKTSNGANDPIEFEYDGNAKTVTVTLNVEGDQPNNVTGFFVRYISATQGSRTDEETFVPNGDGKTWSATFDLTKPGSYTFGSVIADGVEYVLSSTPSVSISGLGINSISCDKNSGTIMTADDYLNVNVYADIDAADELMPKQVRALFRSPDGKKEYTAIMSYNPETEEWEGTARITSSGTYILTYLVMDGDYNLLEEDQQTTLVVYLGLYARVWCTGLERTQQNEDGTHDQIPSTTFDYSGPVTAYMRVQLFDDANKEITAQEKVWLYYHSAGSVLDQDGMYGEVVWNADSGYYEGAMAMNSAGIFNFNRVGVGVSPETGRATSEIRRSTNAPVFTALPPDPPVYVGNLTNTYQFIPNSGQVATMSVTMDYAQAAAIWAVVENKTTGELIMVECEQQNTDTITYREQVSGDRWKFTFVVPDNAGGTQDGEWEIMALCFQNVYVDGVMYNRTETEPSADPSSEYYYGNVCHVIDSFTRVENNQEVTDVITTYVVKTVNIAFKDSSGQAYTGEVFGKDENGNVTGVFMNSYGVTGIKLTITDWKGKAITGIQSVTPVITYNGGSQDLGGYTSSYSLQAEWKTDGSGKDYTLADQTLQHAGKYYVNLTYEVNGQTYSVNRVLNYEVWSVTPTVTITGVGTTASIPTQITWTFGGSFLGKGVTYTLTTNKTNSLDTANNTVTVYAEATEDVGGTGDAGFYLPTLKFTVAGVADTSTVKFTIPAGSASEVNFSFTGNGENTLTLGKLKKVYERKGTGLMGAITYTLYGYSGHGDVTINEFTIVHDGVTYTVKLAKPIVIHNPSSVDQTS